MPKEKKVKPKSVKKEIKVEIPIKEEIKEEVPKEIEKPVDRGLLRLIAKFKGKDEEGNPTIVRYDSEGETIQEALNNMVFPKGVVALVKITAQRGARKVEIAVSPTKSRQILEFKDVFEFEAHFGKDF